MGARWASDCLVQINDKIAQIERISPIVNATLMSTGVWGCCVKEHVSAPTGDKGSWDLCVQRLETVSTRMSWINLVTITTMEKPEKWRYE